MNMKYFRIFLFVVLAFSFVPLAARAELSIAVVDVQKILTESKPAKKIQSDMQAQREKFLNELSKQETQLRQTEKSLSDQSATLPKEDFAKKRREFEETFLQTRQNAQKRKKDLDDALGKAMIQLRDELVKVVESISKEKGYNLVLSKQDVVLNNADIDITEQALAKINSSSLNITLNIPAN
jgi:outer membrane protein